MEKQFVDFGHKMGGPEMPSTAGEGKDKVYYPSIEMPAEIFDGVPAVGSKCRIEVVAEVVEVRKTDKGTEVRVEIHKGRYVEKAGKVSDEEFAAMGPEARKKYQEGEGKERNTAEDSEE